MPNAIFKDLTEAKGLRALHKGNSGKETLSRGVRGLYVVRKVLTISIMSVCFTQLHRRPSEKDSLFPLQLLLFTILI